MIVDACDKLLCLLLFLVGKRRQEVLAFILVGMESDSYSVLVSPASTPFTCCGCCEMPQKKALCFPVRVKGDGTVLRKIDILPDGGAVYIAEDAFSV